MSLQFRRGTDTQRLSIIPAEGEPIWTTDTKQLYVGDGFTTGGNVIGGNQVVNTNSNVTFQTITVTNTATVTGLRFGPTGAVITSTNQLIGPTGPVGAGGTVAYFGSFYDITTQTNASSTSSNVIAIGQTFNANGISIVGGNKVTFSTSGTYLTNLLGQFITTGGGSNYQVTVWIAQNGTTIPNSAYTFTTGGVGQQVLANIETNIVANAGDYLQFYWSSQNTYMQLLTTAAGSSPTRPFSPSVNLTIGQITYSNLGPTGPTGPAGTSFNLSTVTNQALFTTSSVTFNNITATSLAVANTLTIGAAYQMLIEENPAPGYTSQFIIRGTAGDTVFGVDGFNTISLNPNASLQVGSPGGSLMQISTVTSWAGNPLHLSANQVNPGGIGMALTLQSGEGGGLLVQDNALRNVLLATTSSVSLYQSLVFNDSTTQTTAWTGTVAYSNVTGAPASFNLSTVTNQALFTTSSVTFNSISSTNETVSNTSSFNTGFVQSAYHGGTPGAQTAVQANDALLKLSAQPYAGTAALASTGTFQLNVTASENFVISGSTTTNAGTQFSMAIQPRGVRVNADGTSMMKVIEAITNNTGGTNPGPLNLYVGPQSTATLIRADGTAVGIGYGKTITNFMNPNIELFGVTNADSAPDNNGLKGSNIIYIVTSRGNGVSGRRQALLSGDDIGQITFEGMNAYNSTGFGGLTANIRVDAIENFTSTNYASRMKLQTVNTGTTTLTNRLALDDKLNQYGADTHKFTDKSGGFTALSMTTATAVFTAIPVAPNYTATALRAITGQVGAIAAVNDNGGAMAYWDTTNSRWSYIQTGLAV